MMEKNNITLVDALAIIVKWRKLIVLNFIIFSFVAAAISLILPKWYSSTAVLLPPDQADSEGLGMLSLLESLPSSISNLPGMATPSDLYIAILKSRNVREMVIKDLDLQNHYNVSTMEDALQDLDGFTKLDKTEEDLIVIKTTARTPGLAQKMAEAYLQHLDRVNRTKRFTSARYAREFIEKRLARADSALKQSAIALRDFQKNHKVISVEEQTKATITMMANLEAEAALAEVEYNLARKEMDNRHPEVQELAAKVEEYKKQAAKIESGAKLDTASYIMPLSRMPDVGLQYMLLLRDVEVQKAIYKLLIQEYEQAKIKEAKDTPTIQVLDKPVQPEKRSKPKRGLIVISSAILSFFVSFFMLFLFEWTERIRQSDPAAFRQLQNAIALLKGDLKKIRLSKK
jgi:tyrosine-protein kinase Etk/Wzc